MNELTGVPAVDAAALGPVIVPLVALLLVLAVDAAVPGGRRLRLIMDFAALAGLVASAVSVGWLATGPERATACVSGGEAQLPLCSYVVSDLTLALQAVVLVGAVVCLLLALDGPGAGDRAAHHVLLLSATTGALALAGARDMATLVIALETATLPVVGMVALRRDAQGAQAAVTFLLTAVASLGVLLLGVAMVYLATGSLHLEAVATTLDADDLASSVRAVAVVGMILVIAGIGFKVSAVPFHLWTPDTYAGAPLPVAAFLSVVSKAAGIAALVIMLAVGFAPLADLWAPVVGVVAVVTMTVGNLVALRQRVAVRLLAWSTVAQAGWVLLPLAGAGSASGGDLRAAVSASVGYLLAYTVASVTVFAVVILLARHHPAGEEHTLEAYRGLGRREPVAAAVLGLGLACLAGLPPGVMGLVAKVVAVRPVVDAGGWFFAVAAAVNVALGLAYYVRWAGLVVARPDGVPPTWRVTPAEGLAVGAAAAGCIGLSLTGQLVADIVPGLLR